MGKVLVEAVIENVADLEALDSGRITAAEVRSLKISDALVDTGAWGLSVPKSKLEQLGLKYLRTRNAITAGGPREVRMFGTARLTIMGRDCPMDITELPDGCPVLIGQIPLESMDFVVDMRTHKLIGNPAHGGEQIIEIFNFLKDI